MKCCEKCENEIIVPGAAFPDGRVFPSPGDYVICPHCGALYKFNDNLKVVFVPIAAEKILEKQMPDLMRRVAETREFIYQKVSQQ